MNHFEIFYHFTVKMRVLQAATLLLPAFTGLAYADWAWQSQPSVGTFVLIWNCEDCDANVSSNMGMNNCLVDANNQLYAQDK